MSARRAPVVAVPLAEGSRLRLWNSLAAVAHLAQAAVVIALANEFSLPVRATYMTGPPGPEVGTQTVTLLHVNLAWGVFAFFALSALAHLVVAGPAWSSYSGQLARRQNPYRWLEYALSASLMIVLIALLSGIVDVAALVALVGVNAAMIGFGWLQERDEDPGGSLGPFWLGSVAGAVPWVAIGIYLAGPGTGVHPPAFVYGIFFSLFALFALFAINQWLQYQMVGPWRRYLFGERAYIVLSLTAKSLLAWQIFASALASSKVH